MKSVFAFSGLAADKIVPDPDQRYFSGKFEGLQMIAPSGIDSSTDLKKFDGTHGSITVEGGDLLVNERNFDGRAHAHHSFKLSAKYELWKPVLKNDSNIRLIKNLFLKCTFHLLCVFEWFLRPKGSHVLTVDLIRWASMCALKWVNHWKK